VSDGQLIGRGYHIAVPRSWSSMLLARSLSRVMVGIRPEDIDLRLSQDQAALPSVVETVLFQGDQMLCETRLGEEHVRVIVPSGHYLTRGQTVWLALRPDRLFLFDPESGARVDVARDTGRDPDTRRERG